jgi:hypothetical protein
VEEHLETVARLLRERHTTVLDALRTNGFGPLRTLLGEVADAHEAARASLDTGASPTRHDLWEAVRRYRQATLETVWRPLRAEVDALDLGGLLRDQRRALRAARRTVAEATPETLTRPEPTDLYTPADGDGWGRRAVKALVRGARTVEERVRETTRTQTVPLSALVAHHAATTLAAEQAAALDAAEQRLAGWVARLERVATAWTHRLLELERVLDRPDGHVPEVDLTMPESSDDPTSGVMAADVDAVHEEAREQAASLQQCLADGQALRLDDVAEALTAGVETTVDRIRTAADRAGSLFAERPSSPAARLSGDEHDRWTAWFDEATQRLAVLDALATLRDDLTERHAALVADLIEAGLTPVRRVERETADRLRSLRDEVDALLVPPDEGEELDLVQAFDHRADTGTDVLEQTLLAPLRDVAPRRATETVVESHRAALTARVEEQPDGFVVHPLVAPDAERVVPTDDAYTLQWRDGCREVFDEVLFDAWTEALGPLVEATDQVVARATEVRAVVQFNLGAALQELQDLRAARQQGDPDGSFLDDARELALGGLDRAVDLLAAADEPLDRAGGTVAHRTWEASTRVWTELHDRVRAAGQTRAHVLRLRGELVRGARWLALEAGRRLRAATTQVQRTAHRIQRQAQRLVRLGHAAVGTEPVDEAALRETVEALSTVDAVLADLPLVYRRLFSFRPIQDPDLLVARDADRAAVERHRDRWRRGLTDALVLTGPAGSGRTSLLNVLRKTTFRPAQRHSIELTERLTSEAAFANRVVRALGLSLDSGDDLTLDAVAEHLQRQPVPDRLRVCTVEHLEHVVYRTVGGMQLAARVLDFLSETDTRVLWVVTTTNAAWQLVEASEPAAARLATRHTLDPLARPELEELILRRHQRSGLRLVFDPPDESTHPILARRVRALDDEDRRQALLRNEFFDHLYGASGQNVMLALFYWFRSVTLAPDDTTLRVHPLEPIDFGTLDALPLPHAFALKALLEHGTLTVDELAAVLGVPPTTSRSLLETLGNALIVAPAERVEGPGAFQFASVGYDTRYRIRPLLIHPVTRFLRSRNVVH